jgi:hypothetical protein
MTDQTKVAAPPEPSLPPNAAPSGRQLPTVTGEATKRSAPEAGPEEFSGAMRALGWGLRSAWSCRRLLVFMLVVNLVLAAMVLLPLLGPMDESSSHHPEAARLGRHLDLRWWTDWTHAGSSLVDQSVSLLGAASMIMVLAGTFFAGGLLEALRHGPRHPVTFEPLPDPYYKGATPEWRAAAPGPATIRVFLRECASRFPRFLLLLALSLPCYWLVHTLLNRLAVVGLSRLLEQVEDGRLGLLLTIGRAILFVAAFQVVTVIFEYARIHEVLKPGAPLLTILARPFRILRSRPASLIGIEALAFLLQIGAMLAFIPVDRLLGAYPPVAVTAGFAATQIFLFIRLWIRAGAQGAQIRLARSCAAGS